jgi:hypothetical protein
VLFRSKAYLRDIKDNIIPQEQTDLDVTSLDNGFIPQHYLGSVSFNYIKNIEQFTIEGCL